MGLKSVLDSVVSNLTEDKGLGELLGATVKSIGEKPSNLKQSEAPALASLSDTSNSNKALAFKQIQESSDTPQNVNDITPSSVKKPKVLSFGDALAKGLPDSWSIVPPDAGVIKKNIIQ